MDVKLVILALETLQEQISDSLSYGSRAPTAGDSQAYDRVKREIEIFKEWI